MGYSNIDLVKTKLSSARGDKVDFNTSKHFVLVKDSQRNNVNRVYVNMDYLTLSDFFEGDCELLFEYTSQTEFVVAKTNIGGNDFKPSVWGNYTTSDEIISPDGDIVIEPSFWTTADAVQGDLVQLKIHVDISVERAEMIMLETDVLIDSTLQEHGVYENFSINTPQALTVVSTLLSAFYIYREVHIDKCNEKDKRHFTEQWKDKAEKILQLFMRAYLKDNSGTPGIVSFPSLITGIGQPDISNGVEQMSDNLDTLDRKADQDEFFDQEFSSGGV